MKILKLYRDSYTGLKREVWLLTLITLINRTGSMVLPFLSIYLNTVEGYSLALTGFILMAYGLVAFMGNCLGSVLTNLAGLTGFAVLWTIMGILMLLTSWAYWGLKYRF